MSKSLAILGASGHGKVIANMAEELGFTVNFYDDAYPKVKKIEHWLVYGTSSDLIAHIEKNDNSSKNVIVAIGNNEIRSQKIHLLLSYGFTLKTLLHPTAVISKYAEISCGTVVFPLAVINAFAKVGRGAIINTGAIIEHDCIVGDYTHICPNTTLSGGVEIGDNSWIGVGSTLKQLIVIGNNTVVGAGSTVLFDLPSDVTAFGSPAKIV